MTSATITTVPPDAAPGPMVPDRASVLSLRAEGAATFIVALAAYQALGAGWLPFSLIFLAPDLSMLGYLRGPVTGARAYNLGHNLVLPVALGAAGLALTLVGVQAVALIWVAHVGLDRALGFGLKSPAGFRHTHLGTVGRG
ncbi:MAG TPA: DUF4260 domain-containing protein [Acidimicrobiales bacterium]|nr:DUF4260 domain-containing protein [Acidimicrobiales bacterium]